MVLDRELSLKPPHVHASGAARYELERALLVYRTRGGDAYITSHAVEYAGKPLLGAGRALERRELVRLLENAGRDVGIRGWITDRMLYVAPAVIAWWRRTAPAPMFFASGAIEKKARQGACPQPSLVFAVAGRRWYVWAIAGDARPTAQSPLMQAPYLNVYEDGAICEGNVEVPRSLGPASIDGFERAFFESRFTHTNAGELCEYKGGAGALWRDLLDGRHGRFPDAALIRKIAAEEIDDEP
jgi:PRTRC genetic system protein B